MKPRPEAISSYIQTRGVLRTFRCREVNFAETPHFLEASFKIFRENEIRKKHLLNFVAANRDKGHLLTYDSVDVGMLRWPSSDITVFYVDAHLARNVVFIAKYGASVGVALKVLNDLKDLIKEILANGFGTLTASSLISSLISLRKRPDSDLALFGRHDGPIASAPSPPIAEVATQAKMTFVMPAPAADLRFDVAYAKADVEESLEESLGATITVATTSCAWARRVATLIAALSVIIDKPARRHLEGGTGTMFLFGTEGDDRAELHAITASATSAPAPSTCLRFDVSHENIDEKKAAAWSHLASACLQPASTTRRLDAWPLLGLAITASSTSTVALSTCLRFEQGAATGIKFLFGAEEDESMNCCFHDQAELHAITASATSVSAPSTCVRFHVSHGSKKAGAWPHLASACLQPASALATRGLDVLATLIAALSVRGHGDSHENVEGGTGTMFLFGAGGDDRADLHAITASATSASTPSTCLRFDVSHENIDEKKAAAWPHLASACLRPASASTTRRLDAWASTAALSVRLHDTRFSKRIVDKISS